MSISLGILGSPAWNSLVGFFTDLLSRDASDGSDPSDLSVSDGLELTGDLAGFGIDLVGIANPVLGTAFDLGLTSGEMLTADEPGSWGVILVLVLLLLLGVFILGVVVG